MMQPIKIPPLADFRAHPMRSGWLYAKHPMDEVADPYRVRVTLLHTAEAGRGQSWTVAVTADMHWFMAELAKAIDEIVASFKLAKARAKNADPAQQTLF